MIYFLHTGLACPVISYFLGNRHPRAFRQELLFVFFFFRLFQGELARRQQACLRQPDKNERPVKGSILGVVSLGIPCHRGRHLKNKHLERMEELTQLWRNISTDNIFTVRLK